MEDPRCRRESSLVTGVSKLKMNFLFFYQKWQSVDLVVQEA
jgi:hypothetical protein